MAGWSARGERDNVRDLLSRLNCEVALATFDNPCASTLIDRKLDVKQITMIGGQPLHTRGPA